MRLPRQLVLICMIVGSFIIFVVFVGGNYLHTNFGIESPLSISDTIQAIFTLWIVYFAYMQSRFLQHQYTYEVEVNKPKIYAVKEPGYFGFHIINAGKLSAWNLVIKLTNMSTGTEKVVNRLELPPRSPNDFPPDNYIGVPESWDTRPLMVKLTIDYRYDQYGKYEHPPPYSELFTLEKLSVGGA